jgi:hypothetical protein
MDYSTQAPVIRLYPIRPIYHKGRRQRGCEGASGDKADLSRRRIQTLSIHGTQVTPNRSREPQILSSQHLRTPGCKAGGQGRDFLCRRHLSTSEACECRQEPREVLAWVDPLAPRTRCSQCRLTCRRSPGVSEGRAHP